jgi:hypothetical protein
MDQADTGVGPAIASGSQVYNGIWADLTVAPHNNKVMPVSTAGAVSLARGKYRRIRTAELANHPE